MAARYDAINVTAEFTRWSGWPDRRQHDGTQWIDTDAMVREIIALREERDRLREQLDDNFGGK